MNVIVCRARVRRVLLLTGLVFAGLPAGSALADTTVGQTGPPYAFYSGGDEMADPTAVIPAGGGTVTSFQSQSSVGGSGTMNFQVLRPEGSGEYLVVGDTGDVTDPGDGNLDSYAANIPAQAGDVLGVFIVSDWSDAALSYGPIDYEYQSEPSVGQVVSISGGYDGGLNESATVSGGTSASDLAAQLVSDSIGVGQGRKLWHHASVIQQDLDHGGTLATCREIGVYLRVVKHETGSQLTTTQAASLTTDADNLGAALGC